MRFVHPGTIIIGTVCISVSSLRPRNALNSQMEPDGMRLFVRIANKLRVKRCEIRNKK